MAVHSELVGELSFDNGTNFVDANNEMKKLYILLKSKEVNEKTTNFLSNEGIEWHLSPPRTPHFGGIWEVAVKSLKHHMRRTLHDTLFSHEKLCTYLSEIEAILNSRPLTPMSSDPNDFEVLTPGHFLIGQSFMSVPTPDLSAITVNRLSSWQHLQKLRQDLWKSWHNEYLTELNVRNKWHTGQANLIKIGSLVVLKDKNLPPLRWPLGRVLETHSGEDGIVRVVTLKTEKGIFKRGLKKVSPLH
ncbi:uncharacterized protein LOC117181156 [Belonocnema kinseyi]|uniref:uncharacterized protein LOC117181156 n=1 Tax=Belonocnema kinseyi TaxID=2817044 RepID=UPI00143DB80F|nr:uncharacterized protein LOC117181156 [Belonocnema kinseyi]